MPARKRTVAHKLSEPFVRRARYLVERPEFGESIDDVRAQWNATHPEFGMRKSEGTIPEQRRISLPVPAKLRRAVDHEVNEVNDINGIWATGRRKVRLPRAREEVITDAYRDWVALVDLLTTRWWPEDTFFPNYGGWRSSVDAREMLRSAGGEHPAAPFVGACLVWGPPQVAADVDAWIARWANGSQAFDYSPTGPSPFAVRMDTAFTHLVRSTEATPDQIVAALEAGKVASAATKVPTQRWIRIPDGASSVVLRDLAAEVLEDTGKDAERHKDRLRVVANRLRDAGRSYEDIAGELGQPESTVRSWLRRRKVKRPPR